MKRNIYKKYLEKYRNKKETTLKKHVAQGLKEKEVFVELFLLNSFMPPNSPKDIINALNYLDTVLQLDPGNIDFLLAKLYLTDQLTFISEDLYKRILALKSYNYEQRSMIEYAKSWYFHDEKYRYEKCLKKSIEYYQKHVFNYIELGSFYKNHINFFQGKKLQMSGLNNVQLIIIELMEPEYYLKIDNFLNEKIKGIYQTKENYENLIKLIKS